MNELEKLLINQCLNLQDELISNPKICGDRCGVDGCFNVCSLENNHKGINKFEPNMHRHDSINYSLPAYVHRW